MSVKNKKNKLTKTIYSGFSDLSKDEIKNLIKKEVEKGPDAADADYIDFCFELLKSKDGAGNEHKRTNYKPRKVLLIAAVVTVIVMISTMTVSAAVFNVNIPQKIVDLFTNSNDYVLSNIAADGYALADTALYKELAAHEITPVTLPEFLTYEGCTVTSTEYIDDGSAIYAIITLDYNGNRVDLMIDHYFKYSGSLGTDTGINTKSRQMVSANGMDVMVYEYESDFCAIRYRDYLTYYHLYFDFDLDTTLEFAKSIK